MIFAGAMARDQLGVLWLIADILNGPMAVPNLVALLLLSPLVFRLTIDYFEAKRDGGSLTA